VSKGTLIRIIEEQNGELAKEILLNESAIYEAEKEIQKLSTELFIQEFPRETGLENSY
jgi:hypothetical protein